MTLKQLGSQTKTRRQFLTTAGTLMTTPLLCSLPEPALTASNSVQDDVSLKSRLFNSA